MMVFVRGVAVADVVVVALVPHRVRRPASEVIV